MKYQTFQISEYKNYFVSFQKLSVLAYSSHEEFQPKVQDACVPCML